jgi:hypothetical protein
MSHAAFIIRKSSRCDPLPYRGPSCGLAGVPPGTYYLTRDAAEVDARKLATVNGVGWEVAEVVFGGTIDG